MNKLTEFANQESVPWPPGRHPLHSRKASAAQQKGTTAIRSATAIAKQSDTIYSLNGTRRNAMQKGVNIINGRKIITK